MKRTPALILGVLAVAIVTAFTALAQTPSVPKFAVDPSWPKPLPNNWVIGQVAGVAVDARDHIWILHRPATLAGGRGANAAPPKPGVPAPPVIEFDADGNLVQAWGGAGAGYDWPANEHGMSIDYKGNVWVTGGGARDAHVIRFTNAGKLVLQIGKPGVTGGNNDPTGMDRPTDAVVDPKTNEVYVTDGEVGGAHRRVIVFDADTGAYKRHWGGYGERPIDGPATPYDPNAPVSRQFGTATHCVRISTDDLVYICDRSNNRIQVFRKNGTFVKEGFIEKQTLGLGAIWDLELSRDEKYIYVGDGQNNKIWILLRDSLQEIGSFAEPGSGPGQLSGVNAVAVDSKGNLYVAEAANGSRTQKFAFKGF
jgi:DNA-binding beta-propeller fold protein YncE